jgi:hypothetical protein
MKITFTLMLGFIFMQLIACTGTNKIEPVTTPSSISNTDTMKLKITVGNHVFTATLLDNATTAAFIAKLPLTLKMNELNGNEKYGDLAGKLPTDAASPGTIKSGDLMLYGNNILVLFYKTFPTSYSYTRLGNIDNPGGLTDALGSGDVTIVFYLE